MSQYTVARPQPLTCTPKRAARELGLKRAEVDLAVHLGRIRTVPDEGGGGRRIAYTELERLRAEPDFPESFLEGVRAVGTGEAAELLRISPARFSRLARLGVVVPVRFYLNRYRAVVWLYLADELRQFAADPGNAPLLTGRTPDDMRARLTEGADLRPRNWRGRHLGFLLRQADNPWQRAGALATFLDPAQVAELVPDPYERARLSRSRPTTPAHGAPGSPSAHLAATIMTADDPDEIAWLRADLTQALAEARTDLPAPRPAWTPEPTPEAVPDPVPAPRLRTVPAPAPSPQVTPAPRAAPAPEPRLRTQSPPDPAREAHPAPQPVPRPAPEPEPHLRTPAPRSRHRLPKWLRRRSRARQHV
ncbi:hypothetical protein IAG44_34670 [Streptomyces roseirectus]|uniref:Uncharacterized protein n=1 Tax=Streptomyces roseirectus TaxID=2768066 RepID=A0A7H0IMT4_9ACTN|nr:DUF6397 family protein [Streptomyces roseirectus]QNP74100.1 hypothetical protein IAG44_34670 [Streptomyces roseirectus]